MRPAEYLAQLPAPTTDAERRDRVALEHLLMAVERDAPGGMVDLAKARWPAIARRLVNAGSEELDGIHRRLRAGASVRDLFPTTSAAE